MIGMSVLPGDWAPAFAAIDRDTRVTTRKLLELVGEEVVTYLRSLTDEMRPPAKRRPSRFSRASRRFHSRATGRFVSRAVSFAERPAHPGHWADITGDLAAGYSWTVTGTGAGARLTLENDTAYAFYLDAHEGFFVLRGVTDPGGPVDTAIRAAVQVVAPDWDVTNDPGTETSEADA